MLHDRKLWSSALVLVGGGDWIVGWLKFSDCGLEGPNTQTRQVGVSVPDSVGMDDGTWTRSFKYFLGAPVSRNKPRADKDLYQLLATALRVPGDVGLHVNKQRAWAAPNRVADRPADCFVIATSSTAYLPPPPSASTIVRIVLRSVKTQQNEKLTKYSKLMHYYRLINLRICIGFATKTPNPIPFATASTFVRSQSQLLAFAQPSGTRDITVTTKKQG